MAILKNMSSTAASVLVIEKQPLMRETICAAIAGEADLKIAGQVISSSEVLDMLIITQPDGNRLLAFKPDIILFTLGNPWQAEISMLKTLRKSLPDTAILALTSSELDGQEQVLLDAGAQAVLTKSAPRSKLISTLHELHSFKLNIEKLDFENNLDNFLAGLETSSL
jgi:DNA-binding NarL/FixJ family response regulator